MSPETSDFSPSVSSQIAEQQRLQRHFEHAAGNQRLLMVAAMLNSALLLTAIFIAGILTNNETAWKLAICTLSLCFVAPVVQITFPAQRLLAAVLTGGSIIFGGLAVIAITGWLP